MDFGSLTRAQYLQMFKRLLGRGGYSEDDGPNVDELDALAAVAEKTSETLETAGANMFVRFATEALARYEVLFMLPSDAPRTTADRRARLLLFQQIVSSFSYDRVKDALDTFVGSTGTSIVPDVAGRTEYTSCVTWKYYNANATLAERLAADEVLKRAAPAHLTEEPKAAASYATWNTDVDDDGSLLDPAPTTVSTTDTQFPARIVSFGAGSTLTTAMIKEIQANLFWSYFGGVPTEHNFSNVLIRGTVTAATTVTVDGPSHGTQDWSDRVVEAYGVMSTLVDINDSGGTMDLVRAPTDVGWAIGKPTVGDVNFTDLDSDASMDLSIGVDGSGNLELINANPTLAISVAIWVRSSGPTDGSSTTNTAPWIHAKQIDKSGGAPTAFDALKNAGAVRPQGNTTTAGGWTPAASSDLRSLAVRRIAGRASVTRPGSGATSYVLDSTVDWRDRYILVSVAGLNSSTGAYPGAKGMDTRGISPAAFAAYDSVPRLFFSRDGAASGSASWQQWQFGNHPTSASSSAWIYAHEDTGDLMMEVKTGDAAEYVTCFFQVIASDRLATTPAQPTIPTASSYVQPVDLNVIQDNGVSIQGQRGSGRGYPSSRRVSLSTTLNSECEATPLGPISLPGRRPFVPASWSVTERQGALPDALIEHRQHIWGNRKIMSSLSIADGAIEDIHLVNDASLEESYDLVDMRDRIVRVVGVYSTTDIRYHQTAADDTTKFAATLYTGPGTAAVEFGIITNLTLRAKITHREYDSDGKTGYQSVLQIKNATGSTYYVYALIEVSPQLGFGERRITGGTA